MSSLFLFSPLNAVQHLSKQSKSQEDSVAAAKVLSEHSQQTAELVVAWRVWLD
jgi:hypothetical protein